MFKCLAGINLAVCSIAGLLLVLLLFHSKATIKDGNINGFVLYVNIRSEHQQL